MAENKTEEEKLADVCLEILGEKTKVALSLRGLTVALSNTLTMLRAKDYRQIDLNNISFELTLGFLYKKHIEYYYKFNIKEIIENDET